MGRCWVLLEFGTGRHAWMGVCVASYMVHCSTQSTSSFTFSFFGFRIFQIRCLREIEDPVSSILTTHKNLPTAYFTDLHTLYFPIPFPVLSISVYVKGSRHRPRGPQDGQQRVYSSHAPVSFDRNRGRLGTSMLESSSPCIPFEFIWSADTHNPKKKITSGLIGILEIAIELDSSQSRTNNFSIHSISNVCTSNNSSGGSSSGNAYLPTYLHTYTAWPNTQSNTIEPNRTG